MELYYWKATEQGGNFGDDINAFMWEALLGRPLSECYDTDTLFIGIGTVLGRSIPAKPRKKIVFSTGAGYWPVPRLTSDWDIRCVRGPLTAKLLGIERGKGITDGAILLRNVVDCQSSYQVISFMPHLSTAKLCRWQEVCSELNIHYIDPRLKVDAILADLRRTSLLITEAMHGAIVADTMRIPWIPVKTHGSILDFKWQDWCASMEMEHRFEWLVPLYCSGKKALFYPLAKPLAIRRLKRIVAKARPRLSREQVFHDRLARMEEQWQTIFRDA